jgi:hypothetical protein
MLYQIITPIDIYILFNKMVSWNPIAFVFVYLCWSFSCLFNGPARLCLYSFTELGSLSEWDCKVFYSTGAKHHMKKDNCTLFKRSFTLLVWYLH